MVFEVKQEYKKCIGCGACVSIDPEHWEFNDKENKAVLKNAKSLGDNQNTLVLEIENPEKIQEAADACPVQCILVKEKKSD